MDAGRTIGLLKDRLGAIYPGIQLANCRVLGLHEPSALRIRSSMQEGIALLMAAVACQVGWQICRAGGKRGASRRPATALEAT